MKQLKIGITGGIGSGKSVVSSLLRVMGVPVYDADAASKRLLVTDAKLIASLKSLLDDDIYEGNVLNKKKMASSIFANKDLLAQVNALIHPAVIEDFKQWTAQQKTALVACESALVYEAKMEPLFDAVLMVYAPMEIRLQRTMKRDGATDEQVKERMNNQLSDEEKRNRADYVVVNDNVQSLIEQTRKVVNALESAAI